MSNSLTSLIATGTKLYLDSIDPLLIRENIRWGATGATSNPIIVSALLRSGRFDHLLEQYHSANVSDDDVAWAVTDRLVRDAQEAFLPTWERTRGNEGWVSFELDPLIEDPVLNLPHADRVIRYVELGRRWAQGHKNRMIKVPATPAGLASLEELAAAGVALNVTLIFTESQYEAARDAVWNGASTRSSLEGFKSVYSIFVSRVDQYTLKHTPQLSSSAQGQVGIINAKRIWKLNQKFWQQNPTPLSQEIIFASTGTKDPKDPPWKYVDALAGSDIQTNPPETNDAIASTDISFHPKLLQPLDHTIEQEVDQEINWQHLESTLMREGIDKFAQPQHALLQLIKQRRELLTAGA